jgi:hypothetical protein
MLILLGIHWFVVSVILHYFHEAVSKVGMFSASNELVQSAEKWSFHLK